MALKHDRKHLAHLALKVREALALELQADFKPLRASISESGTDGWIADLGRIPGERGATLQLWLDDFTRSDGRRYCFCLKASQDEYISEVIKLVKTEFGKMHILRDQDWGTEKDVSRLLKPLPKDLFNRPIGEQYQRRGSWSFISLYHSSVPGTSSKKFVADGVSFLSQLARALIGARANEIDLEFPQEINRTAVRRHLVRERSAAAAYAAKVRDSYTCKVCAFNFSTTYGKHGAGFAEAHHVLPLSSAKIGSRTRAKDIITVCSNCHRMLHRLDGKRKDAERLRKLLKRARVSERGDR